MEKEIWKQIDEYKKYYVSNFGRIKSHHLNKITILKTSKKNNKTGYPQFFVYGYGKPKCKHVHRMVGKYFVDGYSKTKNQINHKDLNKSNNHFNNLEWCDHKYNCLHAIKNGVTPKPPVRRGEQNNKCKLKEHQVIEIYKLAKNKTMKQKEIAKIYKIDYTNVQKILYRKTWKHLSVETPLVYSI
jgi:hypothetical protein